MLALAVRPARLPRDVTSGEVAAAAELCVRRLMGKKGGHGDGAGRRPGVAPDVGRGRAVAGAGGHVLARGLRTRLRLCLPLPRLRHPGRGTVRPHGWPEKSGWRAAVAGEGDGPGA